MICSTPIEGDHYFVDLIGGMLIAVAAIKLSVAPWPRVALRIAGLRAPGSAVQGVG
jgi:membrane-associated phospholipid phosphatase